MNKRYNKLISKRNYILDLIENRPWLIIKYHYKLLYLGADIMAIELMIKEISK